MVFHWNLSDCKSTQISNFIQSVLTDFSGAVVGMVSICPLIFSSLSLFSRIFRIIPRAPITIGIMVSFIFHTFF